MQTKLVLGFLAGAVVIAGAVFYISGSNSGTLASDSSGQSAAAAEAGPYSGSISDLSKRGGDWKCTVNAEASTGAGQAVSSGVVYVSGKQVRADFTSNVQGYGSVDSHMLADGTDVYSWSSLVPMGVKVAMSMTEGDVDAPTSGQGADANQSYTYDCEPYAPDASLFSVPTTVTFRTI